MSEVLSSGKLHALLLQELELEREIERRRLGNRLAAYRPYRKQREFHAAGKTYRERLLKAGNQLGKTHSAAYETAMHMTGRYPDNWPGRVFERPVLGWAAGVTNEVTRDSLQLLLMGAWENFGTGSIPRDAIKEWDRRSGVDKAIQSVVVRHGGGGDVQAGESMLGIKSYEQGRERFQAATLDLVWLDEEPELEIYTECLTRTNATGGMVYVTFTPLKGMSDTVKRFLVDKVPGTHVTTMTIHDAEHYTPEQRAAIIASYPAHEREARVNGVPTLGSGRIFPVTRESIEVAPFALPDHWPRIGGLDFGWTHPSAAAELAWDQELDIVYLTKCTRQKEATPLMFAARIKPWGGDWMPWAWPADGLQKTQGNEGRALRDRYAEHGLNMLEKHATNAPQEGEEEGTGGNGVDAPLLEMLDRMQTGRWKVFSSCGDWLEEFLMYHRKDGKIVKIDEDTIDASRYAFMMLRHAATRPAPAKAINYRNRMLA
jgi:phage terminase large subunit-like protein